MTDSEMIDWLENQIRQGHNFSIHTSGTYTVVLAGRHFAEGYPTLRAAIEGIASNPHTFDHDPKVTG